jgi:hypothetical protein
MHATAKIYTVLRMKARIRVSIYWCVCLLPSVSTRIHYTMLLLLLARCNPDFILLLLLLPCPTKSWLFFAPS